MLLADIAAAAYEAGRAHERARLAERVDQLDAGWRPPTVRTPQQLLDARLAEAAATAVRWRAAHGWPLDDWPGGTPEQAQEWCRRRDATVYRPITTKQ